MKKGIKGIQFFSQLTGFFILEQTDKMGLKGIVIAIVFIVAVHAQYLDSPRRTGHFKINIREPITLIKSKLAAVFNNLNPVQVRKTVFVNILQDCLLPAIVSCLLGNKKVDVHPIAMELEKLATTLEFIPTPLSLADAYNLSDYCHTPGFKVVHDFLIVDDQWADLLKFFYNTGYPEVYSVFINLYTVSKCPPELIADLPTGPSKLLSVKGRPTRSNLREEVLMSQSLFYPEQTCNIVNITTQLCISGLLKWVDLFETVSTQFRSNPSLHFLAGKIQEPNKGLSFREFRQLPPIKNILVTAHENMLGNPIWNMIFNLIKTIIGFDFCKVNPVDTLVSILEFFIWQTPFPIPPPLFNTTNNVLRQGMVPLSCNLDTHEY